jgi:hypothetical protein
LVMEVLHGEALNGYETEEREEICFIWVFFLYLIYFLSHGIYSEYFIKVQAGTSIQIYS